MKTHFISGVRFFFLSLFVFNTACSTRLEEDPLSIGVLDEEYSDQVNFSDNSIGNDEYIFSLEDGDLPDGLSLSADGEITGTPSSLGLYEFLVRIYGIDNDSEDNQVDTDEETFELFVTEASTNEDCPTPNNEEVTETYICAGSGFLDTLAQDEEFTLDINYVIDFDKASDYRVSQLVFTITYDDDTFEIDENNLNSQILREAASSVNADVSFDNDAGSLQVTINTDDEDDSLRFSGRLIDIPVTAKIDVPAASYEFGITLNSISSHDGDVHLPESEEINGTVTVEFDL